MRDALVTPLLDAALRGAVVLLAALVLTVLLWTQGRDQSDRDPGSFDARRDYRNLFAARPDNVLLIKAA